MRAIEQATGWPGLGLVPFFKDAGRLPAEDALALDGRKKGVDRRQAAHRRARLSAHLQFRRLRSARPRAGRGARSSSAPASRIPGTTGLVILPGSKATIADLAALRETGWHIDIEAHRRRGGHVLGICGGYQMLGTPHRRSAGHRRRAQRRRWPRPARRRNRHDRRQDAHRGHRHRRRHRHILLGLRDARRPHDGARLRHASRSLLRRHASTAPSSPDGRVSGAYIHGLFSDDAQRARWLERLSAAPSQLDYESDVEDTLDALADHLEAHIDCDRLLALARAPAQ